MNAPAPARSRAAFDWPMPGPVPDLDSHPQLAVVAVLHETLSAAWHALLAAHPDIAELPANPRTHLVTPADIARGLLPLIDELPILLAHYQDALQPPVPAPARPPATCISPPTPNNAATQLAFAFTFPCQCPPPRASCHAPAPAPPPPPAVPLPSSWTTLDADSVWNFLNHSADALFHAHKPGLARRWPDQAHAGDPPPHGEDFRSDRLHG